MNGSGLQIYRRFLLIMFISLGLIKGSLSQNLSASITPNTTFSSSTESFCIRLTVNSDSIIPGAGIKLRFPKGFGVPQVYDSTKANYVRGFSSKQGVNLVSEARSRKDTLVDWDVDYQGWNLTFRVSGGNLYPGDTVYIRYGGTASNTKVTTPKYCFSDSVLLAFSPLLGAPYIDLMGKPVVHVKSGNPTKLFCYVPSTISIGDTANMRVVVMDKFGNRGIFFTGRMLFTSSDSNAIYPSFVDMTSADSGMVEVKVVFGTTGIQTMHAEAQGKTPLTSWSRNSNPILVSDSSLGENLYWGDLHSHSSISYDGEGTGSFEYAEKVSSLDFFASTEHCSNYIFGIVSAINPTEMDYIKSSVMSRYKPGKFVTLFGYEFTASGAGGGHHNVFFRASNAEIPSVPFHRLVDVQNVKALWAKKANSLANYDFFTVPHHTGISFLSGNPPVVKFDGTYVDSTLRPLVEIFSDHGLSEAYEPSHGLSYENITDSNSASVAGPHYARDGWVNSEQLGTIAASDNHEAMPGGSGLTGVYAPSLTREDIYDALKSRRTFGTSGRRMIIKFKVNDAFMGSTINANPTDYNKIEFEVHGTSPIEFVEVLKWSGEFMNGNPVYETVCKIMSPGMSISKTIIDCNDFSLSDMSVYYLRVKEVSNVFNNHHQKAVESWGWSSPVWIKKCISCNTNPSLAFYASSNDTTICAGDTVTFSAGVNLDLNNSSFKWYRNDSLVSDSTSYITSDLDNGDKLVCVFNADSGCILAGPVVSDTIVMNVNTLPVVTSHPSTETICTGVPHRFYVYGDFIDEYQWQHKKYSDSLWSNLYDNIRVSDVTTPGMLVNESKYWMDGNKYRCIVSNMCGSVYSDSASLFLSGIPEPSETIYNNDKVVLRWTKEPLATQYRVAYKNILDNNWTVKVLSSNVDSLKLKRLYSGDYQWKVKSDCDGQWGTYSSTRNFSVTCGVPLLNEFQQVSDSTGFASWSKLNEADLYELKYKEVSGAWINGGQTQDTFRLVNGLQLYSTYNYIIRARCGTIDWTEYSLPGVYTMSSMKATGTIDLQESLDVKLYPNPFNDYLNLVFDQGLDSDLRIEIMDIKGKLISTHSINGSGQNSESVELSELSNGMYVIRIIANDGISVQRMIKQ